MHKNAQSLNLMANGHLN